MLTSPYLHCFQAIIISCLDYSNELWTCLTSALMGHTMSLVCSNPPMAFHLIQGMTQCPLNNQLLSLRPYFLLQPYWTRCSCHKRSTSASGPLHMLFLRLSAWFASFCPLGLYANHFLSEAFCGQWFKSTTSISLSCFIFLLSIYWTDCVFYLFLVILPVSSTRMWAP